MLIDLVVVLSTKFLFFYKKGKENTFSNPFFYQKNRITKQILLKINKFAPTYTYEGKHSTTLIYMNYKFLIINFELTVSVQTQASNRLSIFPNFEL